MVAGIITFAFASPGATTQLLTPSRRRLPVNQKVHEDSYGTVNEAGIIEVQQIKHSFCCAEVQDGDGYALKYTSGNTKVCGIDEQYQIIPMENFPQKDFETNGITKVDMSKAVGEIRKQGNTSESPLIIFNESDVGTQKQKKLKHFLEEHVTNGRKVMRVFSVKTRGASGLSPNTVLHVDGLLGPDIYTDGFIGNIRNVRNAWVPTRQTNNKDPLWFTP